ncbi:MAG: hypothetical protein K0S74_1467 [Chlamydiales bacterium]|jgi:hypothetical protein|nr:hypothetical protein [Chlamydiales bacterium]
MEIQLFLNALEALFKGYQAKELHTYAIDGVTGFLAKKSFISSLWISFLRLIGKYSEEGELLTLLNHFTNHTFGTYSAAQIREQLEKDAQSSKLLGLSYKNFLIIDHIKNSLISELSNHANPQIVEGVGVLAEKLTTLAKTFYQALSPDLSCEDQAFVDSYEETVSQILEQNSVWFKLNSTEVLQLLRRLRKEGKQKSFYETLKGSQQKLILHCKKIGIFASSLCTRLRMLEEKGVIDFRFDLKELDAIAEIANFFTYTFDEPSPYAQNFNELATQILHPQFVERYGPVADGNLTFKQLQEGLNLAYKNFKLVDDLVVDEKEFKAKQQLVYQIWFGSEAWKQTPCSNLYPFTCHEFSMLKRVLGPITSFQEWHLKHTLKTEIEPQQLSDEMLQFLLKKCTDQLDQAQIQKINQIFDTFDIKVREVLKQELINSLNSYVTKIIQHSTRQTTIDQLFEKNFFKQILTLDFPNQKSHFDFTSLEQKTFELNGTDLITLLKERYGNFFLIELESTQEQGESLHNKLANRPIDGAILEKVRQKELDLFWKQVSAQHRYQLKQEYSHLSTEEGYQRARQLRQTIKNCCNEQFGFYAASHFSSEMHDFFTAVERVGFHAIAPFKAEYNIDKKLHYLSCKRIVEFEPQANSCCKGKGKGCKLVVNVAQSIQMLRLNLEKDSAEYIEFDKLYVNDRSLPLLNILKEFIKDTKSSVEESQCCS